MNPRRILGVDDRASQDEIRKAYLQLAKKLHPDVNQAPAALETMRLVNLAYAELTSGASSPPPSPPRSQPREPFYGNDPCETRLWFGKHRGLTLVEVWAEDPGYLNWVVNTFDPGRVTELILGMLKHVKGGVWPLSE